MVQRSPVGPVVVALLDERWYTGGMSRLVCEDCAAERELAPGELIADYTYRCEPCASRFVETKKRSQRKIGLRLVGAGLVMAALFVIMYVTKTDLDADIHSDEPFSLALVIGYAAIVCVAVGLPMIGLGFRPKLRL